MINIIIHEGIYIACIILKLNHCSHSLTSKTIINICLLTPVSELLCSIHFCFHIPCTLIIFHHIYTLHLASLSNHCITPIKTRQPISFLLLMYSTRLHRRNHHNLNLCPASSSPCSASLYSRDDAPLQLHLAAAQICTNPAEFRLPSSITPLLKCFLHLPPSLSSGNAAATGHQSTSLPPYGD